eukprot:TRINITY_DN4393_c0_g1_i9.p1 TRINITY_DN4393_c0_g1~~TRINITY_DN4393_c0_g1_i9.p1  ORF type:complete len:1103 (+),score=162.08 TRINITY_DN4393_c0_g1_i9:371-3679(+)
MQKHNASSNFPMKQPKESSFLRCSSGRVAALVQDDAEEETPYRRNSSERVAGGVKGDSDQQRPQWTRVSKDPASLVQGASEQQLGVTGLVQGDSEQQVPYWAHTSGGMSTVQDDSEQHSRVAVENKSFTGADRDPEATLWKYTDLSSWGKDYPGCLGTSQSPVDIVLAETMLSEGRGPNLARRMHYTPSMGRGFAEDGRCLRVEGNFGTLELAGGQHPFDRSKRSWQLFQLDFHFPSEHTIDGKRFAGEMQMVHVPDETNREDEIKNVIVSVLLETGADADEVTAPRRLDFFHVGLHTSSIDEAVGRVDLADVFSAQLLGDWFHYKGSSTVPNCSENVLWYVMKKPFVLPATQVEEFKMFTPENSSRPTQALNGRQIMLNNFFDEEPARSQAPTPTTSPLVALITQAGSQIDGRNGSTGSFRSSLATEVASNGTESNESKSAHLPVKAQAPTPTTSPLVALITQAGSQIGGRNGSTGSFRTSSATEVASNGTESNESKSAHLPVKAQATTPTTSPLAAFTSEAGSRVGDTNITTYASFTDLRLATNVTSNGTESHESKSAHLSIDEQATNPTTSPIAAFTSEAGSHVGGTNITTNGSFRDLRLATNVTSNGTESNKSKSAHLSIDEQAPTPTMSPLVSLPTQTPPCIRDMIGMSGMDCASLAIEVASETAGRNASKLVPSHLGQQAPTPTMSPLVSLPTQTPPCIRDMIGMSGMDCASLAIEVASETTSRNASKLVPSPLGQQARTSSQLSPLDPQLSDADVLERCRNARKLALKARQLGKEAATLSKQGKRMLEKAATTSSQQVYEESLKRSSDLRQLADGKTRLARTLAIQASSAQRNCQLQLVPTREHRRKAVDGFPMVAASFEPTVQQEPHGRPRGIGFRELRPDGSLSRKSHFHRVRQQHQGRQGIQDSQNENGAAGFGQRGVLGIRDRRERWQRGRLRRHPQSIALQTKQRWLHRPTARWLSTDSVASWQGSPSIDPVGLSSVRIDEVQTDEVIRRRLKPAKVDSVHHATPQSTRDDGTSSYESAGFPVRTQRHGHQMDELGMDDALFLTVEDSSGSVPQHTHGAVTDVGWRRRQIDVGNTWSVGRGDGTDQADEE